MRSITFTKEIYSSGLSSQAGEQGFQIDEKANSQADKHRSAIGSTGQKISIDT
jgi:hypothetical protein